MIRGLEIKDIEKIVSDEERIFGDSLGAEMIGASLDGSDPLKGKRWLISTKWRITKGVNKQCQEIHNCPVSQFTSLTQLHPV